MPKNRRPARFSATKAVKANARARLGTPPPAVVVPDREHKQRHGKPKHKASLAEVIAAARREEEN